MATVRIFRRPPTLIEILVVIAIIGVLVGLMLPSVQSARESARESARVQVARNFAASSPPASEAAPARASAPADDADAFSPFDDRAGTPPGSAAAGRKIIYDTTVDLVTEDLNRLEARLLAIVAAQRGYVADSDRTGTAGLTREGHWKVRVPADGHDAFVRGVLGLGELVSTKARSQDVGAEFYDVEARAAAKKLEEARLLKHLTDSTGKLDDILAVERELSRVRIEIEQLQGRLNQLTNLTALATVTVGASEIKDYVPPAAPTLATKVGRAFGGSLGSLREFGELALLAGVALVPWSPLLIVGGLLLRWAGRRSGRPPIAAAPPQS